MRTAPARGRSGGRPPAPRAPCGARSPGRRPPPRTAPPCRCRSRTAPGRRSRGGVRPQSRWNSSAACTKATPRSSRYRPCQPSHGGEDRRRRRAGVTRRRSPSTARDTGTMPRSATPGTAAARSTVSRQHPAVVPAGAEDDLQVQLEAGRREPLERRLESRPRPDPSGGRGPRRPRRAATRRGATDAARRCARGRPRRGSSAS